MPPRRRATQQSADASTLVIVESPAKARTIKRFLGDGYSVASSIGHIRDLPASAAEVPKNLKGKDWATLAVDVDEGFRPVYIIPTDKKRVVTELRRELKGAGQLLLATDEDREGEAIAWHLIEVLKPKTPVRRLVFHEITRSAITEALSHTREIDQRLVQAQESRRVLDRLIGYLVSPVLWKKVGSGLSAGRVQTPALWLIVQRERERMAFVSAAYCIPVATLSPVDDSETAFDARLISLDGNALATAADFDPDTGELRADSKARRLPEADAQSVVRALASVTFQVTEVTKRPRTRRPQPPFITSTLQRAASTRLRFSPRQTMRVAQQLYENGLITYMRTDSPALSAQATDAARTAVRAEVPKDRERDYLPERPRRYRARSARAQEAHEAIRPAGERFRHPDDLGSDVDADGRRLYRLIWQRTLASQMHDARFEQTRVQIAAEAGEHGTAVFQANGQVVVFDGFLRIYAGERSGDSLLPDVAEGDRLQVHGIDPGRRETRPPDRWTEASLIRELERLGVGRPSTYATILETVQGKYVERKEGALVPRWHAFAVIQLLEAHFPELVDSQFTARMEDGLDRVAEGSLNPLPWLSAFYFGADAQNGGAGMLRDGLRQRIEASQDAIDARAVCTIPLAGPNGSPIAVRIGRYGPYLEAVESGARAQAPEDLAPDQLTSEVAAGLLAKAASGDEPLGADPESGLPVFLKSGRLGPYLQLGPSQRGRRRPKTASVWPMYKPETLTLEQALDMLAYPKTLGAHPESRSRVTVQDGPYGPYIKCGKESRSLPGEGAERYAKLASIELSEALEILNAPRQPRGRRAQTAALAELGAHPASGAPITVRDGRYGPYVTDGELNASLPRGRDPATVSLDEAVTLLAARAERVAAQGGRRRRTGTRRRRR
ncbi:MAG: type I DNA topoisomerase [Chloroflexota bacterium]|nr:type I DNA topoisomerase [Chloroflexota bacterium]MDE2920355.1 type I DNA topoisomerase [Chloroflexota bacterium]